jgi:O-antigen/teichoic acid export membrane protein
MPEGRLFKNILSLATAQVITKLVNVAASIAIVRYLGSEELGRYSYVLAFAYPFGAVADFGLAAYAIREISRGRSREPEVIATLRRTLFLCAGLGWIVMMGCGAMLHRDAALLASLALAGFASILSAVTTPMLVSLTAREDLRTVAVYQILGSLFGSAAVAGALLLGGKTVALLLGSTAANLVMFAVMYGLVGWPPASFPVSRSAVGGMIREALPFGLLLVGFAVYYRIDMVMLEWLRGTREIGLYAAAYRFLDAIIPMAAAIARPFYPRFSGLADRDSQGSRELLEKTWKPLLGLVLPLAIGVCFAAEPLTLALFGGEFKDSVVPLQILIWGSLPLALVMIPVQALMAADRVWPLVGVYGLSAGLNIIGNLLLIPRWGAVGAATMTVVCEWFNLALVGIMLRREFAVGVEWRGLWRYALAATGMAFVLWLAQSSGVAIAVLSGAMGYGTMLVVLGCVKIPDLVELKRLLAGSAGR